MFRLLPSYERGLLPSELARRCGTHFGTEGAADCQEATRKASYTGPKNHSESNPLSLTISYNMKETIKRVIFLLKVILSRKI